MSNARRLPGYLSHEAAERELLAHDEVGALSCHALRKGGEPARQGAVIVMAFVLMLLDSDVSVTAPVASDTAIRTYGPRAPRGSSPGS